MVLTRCTAHYETCDRIFDYQGGRILNTFLACFLVILTIELFLLMNFLHLSLQIGWTWHRFGSMVLVTLVLEFKNGTVGKFNSPIVPHYLITVRKDFQLESWRFIVEPKSIKFRTYRKINYLPTLHQIQFGVRR